jgi:hypothetical protein
MSVYALVDCNCFFVSCERLFRPELEGRPVVVLSSNDGCVVSRSQEAKDLGVPMGAPLFKWRELFQRHGIVAFSANFELYGDVSERITNLLASITPRIEVYSVDESFLDLSELEITDYEAWGRMVRENILQHVGVPVSVGIAGSKTLAKAANDRAKKIPDLILRTNRHKPGYQQFFEPVRFYTPTSDTSVITSQLVQVLQASFRSGLEYHKADILLYDLVAEDQLQIDLLGTVDLQLDERSRRKMRALDSINLQHGKGTIKFAAENLSQAWQPRKRLSSPRYTSSWQELPEVHPR